MFIPANLEVRHISFQVKSSWSLLILLLFHLRSFYLQINSSNKVLKESLNTCKRVSDMLHVTWQGSMFWKLAWRSFWNIIWFSISKKHKHLFSSKFFIKFSNFRMWIMLPKIFYFLSANFNKVTLWEYCMETAFKMQLWCTSSGYKLSIVTWNYQPIDS